MATRFHAELEAHLAHLGLKTPIPTFPNLRVLTDPLDLARAYLADQLHEVVQGEAEHALSAVQIPATVDPLGGDLTIILPKLARQAGTDVDGLRTIIIDRFPKHPLFQQPAPDGKQLKIFFHSKVLAQILLPYIHDRQSDYGVPIQDVSPVKQKLLLEFSSPNIVADLNGKHFRSTLLGAQLAALHQEQGWDVTQINYLGDWGKPIGLLGAGYERFGSEELLKSEALHHLRDVHKRMTELLAPELAASKKARDSVIADDSLPAPAVDVSKDIHAERDMFSSKLEAGDEKMLMLWKTLRDESINAYRQVYTRLGINFDHYTGESQVGEATMADVIERLKAKGFCEDEGGWLVVHLQNHGSKHGTAKLRDPAGGSTYLLRDIGAAIEREREHAFDKMLYVVANDQHATHFPRMFKILELLDMTDLAGKLQHVSFNESSHLPAPSSAGDSVESILNRFQDLFQAASVNSGQPLLQKDETMSNLAITTCYAQVSSVRRTGELKFDIPMLASLDTPGPLEASKWLARMPLIPLVSTEDGHDENEHYLDDFGNAVLLRWLAHYPDVVQGALRALEPATILHYTGSLTAQLEDSFENDDISASSQEHAVFLQAVRIVLSNALRTLKITRASIRDSGVIV